MRRRACAAFLVFACVGAARAQECDESNPSSRAATTQIRLGPGDVTSEARDELRSFVVTGSLGAVDAKIAGSSPPGIVASLSAMPEISRFSEHFGEQLKGIDIRVALKRADRSATVSVSLRQVCAQYFRDSFLY